MNKLIACLTLLGALTGAASAGTFYTWEADCTERYYLKSGDPDLILGCPASIRGRLTMPDSFVPGTPWRSRYGEDAEGFKFTMYDQHFGTFIVGADFESAVFDIPADGNAWGGFLTPAGHFAFGFGFWELMHELGGNDSLQIRGTRMTFTRTVPEPAVWALVLLPLLALATRRARPAPPGI